MARNTADPAPRARCKEVRFRITANGRDFTELKKLLATLLKAGRPDFQTRSTIRLVVDDAFIAAYRKLLNYGQFPDETDATLLASLV